MHNVLYVIHGVLAHFSEEKSHWELNKILREMGQMSSAVRAKRMVTVTRDSVNIMLITVQS
jgi:hypothetical protein